MPVFDSAEEGSKPANIIVLTDGHARLIDLGEASVAADAKYPATPAFGAPEWFGEEQETSVKMDMWSLGLTIAQVRLPIPAGLLAPSGDFLAAFLASRALSEGLNAARTSPTPIPRKGSEVDPDDYVTRWAAYFRDLRSLDHELGTLVVDRLLVPEEAQASAAEVAQKAHTLAAPCVAPLAQLCRQADESPVRVAMRAALVLRLTDERETPQTP